MKNIFIKSTFILLIGGFITKFLGMFIRIVMSRLLPTNAMGSYMMIMPTFSLLSPQPRKLVAQIHFRH